MLAKEISDGWACRFCERDFVDNKGNPICLHKLSICRECDALIPWKEKSLGYNLAKCNVKQNNTVWGPRKSEILLQIQQEVENDIIAYSLESAIRREQKKELFEERWLPKFQEWLHGGVKWDGKKECFTFTFEKDKLPVIIDFYPKGNRVLIRKENRWLDNGSQWLIKNVLPEEYKNDTKDLK
jgi:hypothetical protein